MENSLVTYTYGFNKDREGIVSGLSGYLYLFELNSAQSSVTIGNFTNSCYVYFVLDYAHSSGKKIIGNVTAKNYLKETLLSILCFIIQGKGSSGKRLILKFCFVAYGNLTHNETGRVFCL